MKRLIAAILRPVLRWAEPPTVRVDGRQHAARYVIRDSAGAWEIFECPCGLKLGRLIHLDSLRSDHLILARAARDHLEGSPAIEGDDYQTY